MDELKKVVKIEYLRGGESAMYKLPAVKLKYGNDTKKNHIQFVFENGISQGDIIKAKEGDFALRVRFAHQSPIAIAIREELNMVNKLARRRPSLFGEGDIAFYDLALKSVANISNPNLAFKTEADSLEKGYTNTFNHFTAQALITTLCSDTVADFVGNVHERYYMPELLTGEFTEQQIVDPNINPVDNYVDLFNNELGQILGKYLKSKYTISKETYWTPYLLTNYLNDVQSYYAWSFNVSFYPFKPHDDLIAKFTAKINRVSQGMSFSDY
ncbi:MAG: hypothetical protein H6607_09185 [Flavobacteriales bacterium]|nr:hypothetical protein [Flavobacteriales bacterium]